MAKSSEDTTVAPKNLALRISASTMKELVYEKLRTAIVTGRLRPNQRLVEEKVAAMLNVSRTPLREAILMLEREDLVERLPRGGVKVPAVSQEKILQLNDIRSALEGMAARRAAERIRDTSCLSSSSPELADMDGGISQMKSLVDSGDVLALMRLGSAFHQAVHRLSGNQRCADMAAQVIQGIERYRSFVPEERHFTTIEEHESILNAIRRGLPDEAENHMRTHIEGAGRLYVAAIQNMSSVAWSDSVGSAQELPVH